jgi:hypothetical protein
LAEQLEGKKEKLLPQYLKISQKNPAPQPRSSGVVLWLEIISTIGHYSQYTAACPP